MGGIGVILLFLGMVLVLNLYEIEMRGVFMLVGKWFFMSIENGNECWFNVIWC